MAKDPTGSGNLSRITTASINDTIAVAPPNGFQAFIARYYERPGTSYVLYDGGCNVDGHDNCTAVCQDPTQVFASLATLSNCIAAPFIATGFPALDGASQAIATSFGITDGSLTPTAMNRTLSDCFIQFCPSSNAPRCDPQHFGFTDTTGPAPLDPLAFAFNFGKIICDYTSTELDPDLGGIGVFASFIIQLGIAIGGFILLSLSSSFLYYLTRWCLCCVPKARARRMAQSAQLGFRRLRIPLISALEEFHRTQCFFGMAVQIAALTVIRTRNFNIQTSAQAINNFNYMRLVATNSMLSIPFTLWYLRANTERSWYTHVISLVTFSLACATFAAATTASQGVWLFAPTSSATFPSCGNIDPSSLCEEPDFGSQDPVPQYIFPMTTFFMAWLFLDQLWHRLVRPFCDKRPPLKTRISSIQDLMADKDWRGFTLSLFWFWVKLHAFGWFIYYAESQLQFLTDLRITRSIKMQDWGIGQIIGVTIWSQPVLEFVQLTIGRAKHGFAHRVPQGLQVTADRSKDAAPSLTQSRSWHSWPSLTEDFFFSGTRPLRPIAMPVVDSVEDKDGLPTAHRNSTHSEPERCHGDSTSAEAHPVTQ